MSELVNEYIEASLRAEELREIARYIEDLAEEKAGSACLPRNLMPATAKDIIEGTIIWYPEWEEDEGRCWNVVGEVLNPSDSFKAYYAHEGCRYGLEGAFVEPNK